MTFRDDALVERVLKRIRKSVKFWEEPRADLVVQRSELSSFLKRFGSTDFYFLGHFEDTICKTEGGHVVAFAEKVGKGTLVFLPCYVSLEQYTQLDFLGKFLPALLDGLRMYVPRIQYKPPNWIDIYRFPDEASIVAELEELQGEINKREDSLGRYLQLKEILWFRDTELVDSVMNFLNKMGIETMRDEIREEDFWIVKEGVETIMVEVKGLDKNLKRPHISQLDEHRGAREKPDDFPALLIVNSFSNAKTLQEKDKAISSNEVRKAVRTNVLILRTLDLCNAYSLIESKKLNLETMLNIVRSETGWLNVTLSGYEITKQ